MIGGILINDAKAQGEKLGGEILKAVKEELRGGWDQLNPEIRGVFERASRRAAELAIKELGTGQHNPEDWRDVNAQLLNAKVSAAIVANAVFWQAFGRVIGLLGDALAGVTGGLSKLVSNFLAP